MIIASAMMFLDPSEVAVLGNYFGDRKSCYIFYIEALVKNIK